MKFYINIETAPGEGIRYLCSEELINSELMFYAKQGFRVWFDIVR